MFKKLALGLIGLVVAGGLVVGGAGVAEALTGWVKFGSASAISRTEYGYADASVQSQTAKNPINIQAVVYGGDTARSVNVHWNMSCSGPNNTTSKQGSGTVTVSKLRPWVRNWTAPNLGNGTYCDVYLSGSDSGKGPITLQLQAQY